MYSATKFIEIHPQFKSTAPIRDWYIELRSDGNLLGSFSGAGNPPDKLSFDVQKSQLDIYRTSGEINISYTVTDTFNQACTFRDHVPVSRTTRDSTLDKYSLILFEFKSYELRAKNKNIADFIRSAITAGAEITITGFTDRIGDALINKKLSKQRALATAEGLFGKSIVEDRTIAVSHDSEDNFLTHQKLNVITNDGRLHTVYCTAGGLGEEDPMLFDNSTPEGRFYCRTVNIEVRNPLK